MIGKNTIMLNEKTIKGFIENAVLKRFLPDGKSKVVSINLGNNYNLSCAITFDDKEATDDND